MFQPPCPGGVFSPATRADRAPIGRDEIDIHAELLQKIRGDVAHDAFVIGWSCATRQVTGSAG